jgi:hypothetical protein
MARYALKCLEVSSNDDGQGSVIHSHDFEAEGDLKAVAIAEEYFGEEIGTTDHAELIRDPGSPDSTALRTWRRGV